MIRVLICEDEPPTMRRIRRLVEETDGDFQVVWQAPDGERALEMLDTSPVDVVITDIRMPILDGLSVMDAVSERWPDTQVVVLSGYQDFAYVSHAVRARCMDYLLKPVSAEDMRALLTRLKEEYAQRTRAKISSRLSQNLGRPVLEPAGGPASGGERRLCVGLLCIGPMPMGGDAEMHPGAAVWQGIALEQTFARAVPAHRGFSWAFMGASPVERIFIADAEGGPAEGMLRALWTALCGEAEVPVSCAYAPEGVELSGVGKLLPGLRRTLRLHVRLGAGVFVRLAEDGVMPEAACPLDGDGVGMLAQALRRGLGRQTVLPLPALLARMAREEWTQAQTQAAFERALCVLEAEPGLREPAHRARAVVEEVLGGSLTAREVERGLAALEPVAAGDTSVPSPAQQEVPARVAAYMRAHYQKHINNQTLASAFGYVPSYLSTLFRKAYGVSPSEYLTQVRLEEAKRLIARNPAMLIREVADAVGFKSQHHFSRVFKKNEGVWPSGYAGGRETAE